MQNIVGKSFNPHAKLPVACFPIQITGFRPWKFAPVTAPLVSLGKAKLAKWQARHCRMQRAFGEDGHLYIGSIFPSLHWCTSWIYVHWAVPSLPWGDHLQHTCALMLALQQLVWYGSHRSMGSCEVENAGQFISLPWARWIKREERVVVSGWWDERQMVFAGRGHWPSSSGLPGSLSRHFSSLTCSACHNGLLPFYMKTPTDVHAAMKWAIDWSL